MKKLIAVAALAACALAVSFQATPQSAGQVQAVTPLTRDVPASGALQTLTAATANTYNSADQSGFNVSRVICVFDTTARVGTATATISIQNKDNASGKYYSLITSASISSTTSTVVAAGSGMPATANVSDGRPIARTWRTQVQIGGATSFTGTVGCSAQ